MNDKEVQTRETKNCFTETLKRDIQINTSIIELLEICIYENYILRGLFDYKNKELIHFISECDLKVDLVEMGPFGYIGYNRDLQLLYKLSDIVETFSFKQEITCINPNLEQFGTNDGKITSLNTTLAEYSDSIIALFDLYIITLNTIYTKNKKIKTADNCCACVNLDNLFVGLYNGSLQEYDLTLTLLNTVKLTDFPIISIVVSNSVIYACTEFEFIVYDGKIVFRSVISCKSLKWSILGCLLVTDKDLQYYSSTTLIPLINKPVTTIAVHGNRLAVQTTNKFQIYQIFNKNGKVF